MGIEKMPKTVKVLGGVLYVKTGYWVYYVGGIMQTFLWNC